MLEDSNAKFGRFRRRLEQMLDELTLLRESSADHRASVQLDQQSVGRISRIDAMQNQQIALAADRQRQSQIARIRRALSNLDQDCFGHCVKCGDEISEGRLEADPAAHLCIKCASLRAV